MPLPDVSEIAHALQGGQAGRAEILCRAALADQPASEDLLLLLAMSLHCQGRLPESVAVYARLVEANPQSSLHWNNHGAALLAAGAHEAAAQAFAESIRLGPGNLSPRIQLGTMLIGQREHVRARSVLLDALALDRESPLVRIPAAHACCLCRETDRAQALVKPWRSWLPLQDDALQLELARVLALAHDVPGAAEVLEELWSRAQALPEVALLLASVRERLNQLQDAAAMLAAIDGMAGAMNREQRNEAEHLRATLAARAGDWAGARQILDHCGPQGEDDAPHFFQLAAAHDKVGAPDEAMAALAQAHLAEIRERRAIMPELFADDAPAMPLKVPGASAAQHARWPRLAAPDAADSPVMIVGFPRSGTTLLEQMLDAHPALQSMDENPFFNNLAGVLAGHDPRIMDDLGVLRQYDCDSPRALYHTLVAGRVERRAGTRLVDKNPLNMQWLPMIHRLFPQARIILAIRHPCDVLLSCYMQSFRSSVLAAACGTLERLARAYVQVMQAWIEQAEIFRPTVLVVRHEDLVDDLAGQSARIARFLGLDDAAPLRDFQRHAQAKRYIATPSYTQVIEPINRRGLGRWHNYRAYFEPVLPILESMLRHWGYAAHPQD